MREGIDCIVRGERKGGEVRRRLCTQNMLKVFGSILRFHNILFSFQFLSVDDNEM